MGSTDLTVDQGGSGGSDALQTDGWPMRRVAAEARRVLLDMASTRFRRAGGCARGRARAWSRSAADPSKKITYGELIGGKRFNVTLTGKNTDTTTGIAKLKPVQELKIVGKSPQRYDIPAKVDGSLEVGRGRQAARHGARAQREAAGRRRDARQHRRIVGARHPRLRQGREQGQLRRRGLRARGAGDPRGATAQGQLAEARYRAVPDLRGSLHLHARRDAVVERQRRPWSATPDAAFAGAATVIEAEYDVPFQGHTAIGPAHAMADPSNDQLTIYSNDMKSYGMRNGVAQFLKMPRDRVRVVWMDGPQGYGRTAADDAGFEAAFLAKEIGRPVRVQWMRQEETAWDTKGPAYAFKMRGGLDAQGNLVALDYDARAADSQSSRLQRARHGADRAADGHAASAEPARGRASTPSDMYAIPNRRMTTRVVALPLVWETPLRTGNLRDPDGPQVTFASESFIDELAAAAKADPVEFRLKLLTASTDGRQRLQARAIDRVHQGGGGEVRMGCRGRHRSRAATATSSPVAASPTRIAARPSSRRSRRSR